MSLFFPPWALIEFRDVSSTQGRDSENMHSSLASNCFVIIPRLPIRRILVRQRCAISRQNEAPPARNYEHDLKSLSRLPWRTPSRINDRCVYPPRLRRARGQHSANPQPRGRDAAQTKPASAQPGRMALICLVFLPGLNSLETAHTLRCGRRDSIAAAPKSLSPMATIPPSRARHPDLGSPAVARIPFFPLVPSPMEAVEPLESQQVGSATFCQDR